MAEKRERIGPRFVSKPSRQLSEGPKKVSEISSRDWLSQDRDSSNI
jgi:hypothetical protein